MSVCFIAIKDPDEPDNLWTIWSDDSSAYEDASISDEIKNIGWRYVDHCGNCGSCGGGKEKNIFGKSFPQVCGCTFRIDNAMQEDLPFLKTMIDLRIKELLRNDAISHYDLLIDEDNDPVHDPEPLQDYMNKWDGQVFIDKMQLDKTKAVLEIGVGTGRIAVNVAPKCKEFTGIDISEKTIAQAKKNIKGGLFRKPELICADFLEYNFEKTFDVVYSSLTFMHINEKQKAFDIVSKILNPNGRFVLSIDKNRDEFIDMGTYKVKVFPDNVSDIKEYAKNAELKLLEEFETDFAVAFVFLK